MPDAVPDGLVTDDLETAVGDPLPLGSDADPADPEPVDAACRPAPDALPTPGRTCVVCGAPAGVDGGVCEECAALEGVPTESARTLGVLSRWRSGRRGPAGPAQAKDRAPERRRRRAGPR